MPNLQDRRNGFSLIELLVVIGVVALLVSILLPALAAARKTARQAVCAANLKQFATAHASYAADYRDRIASFTTTVEDAPEIPGPAPTTPVEAAADQAVDILRRRAHRTDIERIRAWTPFVMYGHLVINDYLQQRLPEPMVVCPEDTLRLRWQTDPRNFEQNFLPGIERPETTYGTTGTNNLRRWPYSSSYQLVPAAYSPDTRSGPLFTVWQRPGYKHTRWDMGQARLGGRRLTEVTFPSAKVLMTEQNAWHQHKYGVPYYHMHNAATPQVMLADTSVRIIDTARTNPGFQPNNPTSQTPTRLRYEPEPWEGAALEERGYDLVVAHYRFTRSGLKGVDIASHLDARGEVSSGQPLP